MIYFLFYFVIFITALTMYFISNIRSDINAIIIALKNIHSIQSKEVELFRFYGERLKILEDKVFNNDSSK